MGAVFTEVSPDIYLRLSSRRRCDAILIAADRVCYCDPCSLHTYRVGVGATEWLHLDVTAGLAGDTVWPPTGCHAFSVARISL